MNTIIEIATEVTCLLIQDTIYDNFVHNKHKMFYTNPFTSEMYDLELHFRLGLHGLRNTHQSELSLGSFRMLSTILFTSENKRKFIIENVFKQIENINNDTEYSLAYAYYIKLCSNFLIIHGYNDKQQLDELEFEYVSYIRNFITRIVENNMLNKPVCDTRDILCDVVDDIDYLIYTPLYEISKNVDDYEYEEIHIAVWDYFDGVISKHPEVKI